MVQFEVVTNVLSEETAWTRAKTFSFEMKNVSISLVLGPGGMTVWFEGLDVISHDIPVGHVEPVLLILRCARE